MKKQEAIELFGTAAELARAMECSRAAVSKWPELLTLRMSDRVIGAFARIKKVNANPNKPAQRKRTTRRPSRG